MVFTPSTLAALVIAASFAAGLNVYATVLTLGLLARAHWVALPPGLEPLSSWWVIGASGALFSAEFIADKIPGLDLVWNALHTFIRVPVAALLAYRATAHLSASMQLLATVAGAAIALAAHGSKTAARAVVRQQYNFLPPNDAKLTRQQYKAHIKKAIEDLLFKGEFLMNGVDDQVKIKNNVLCHH